MVPLVYSNDNRKGGLKLTKPGNVIILFFLVTKKSNK